MGEQAKKKIFVRRDLFRCHEKIKSCENQQKKIFQKLSKLVYVSPSVNKREKKTTKIANRNEHLSNEHHSVNNNN